MQSVSRHLKVYLWGIVQALLFFFLPGDWNAEMMAGIQATTLYHEATLEDNRVAGQQESWVLNTVDPPHHLQVTHLMTAQVRECEILFKPLLFLLFLLKVM